MSGLSSGPSGGDDRDMRLTLPLPPSANAYWRAVRGRVLLSAVARQYKDTCALAAAAQWKGGPLEGRISLHGEFYMDGRGDLDNRLKVLLDSLQGWAFYNDSQIWELRAVRHHVKREHRVEIEITEMAA